jgi:hypothetical protein
MRREIARDLNSDPQSKRAWGKRTVNKKVVEIQPKYLDLRQAGLYMGGLTAEAVRHMVRNGRLPVSKLGGRLFIATQDIDEAMESTQIRVIPV